MGTCSIKENTKKGFGSGIWVHGCMCLKTEVGLAREIQLEQKKWWLHEMK